jgi:hypothetical protein
LHHFGWFAIERLDVGRAAATGRCKSVINHKTAIFRRINRHVPASHHDALEFPDGQVVLLTFLEEDQMATVLQLPATATVGSKAPQEAAKV